ncbi:hypothetical protein GAMM_130027 [Gammaproteobacteria bacterium]
MSEKTSANYNELIKKHAGEKFCKLPEMTRHEIWRSLMVRSDAMWGRNVNVLIENIDRDLKSAKSRRSYGHY